MIMNLHSGRASVAMLRMMGCANGRSARHLLHSDCVVDEKTVVLQKKENEGFGFVLRGAKGTNSHGSPPPCFQQASALSSLGKGKPPPPPEGHVLAEKKTFLPPVNQDNVVKVGHRQVVNMIRLGGNRLLIKVVTVSRNLDPDDTARKKAPPPPKRAPTTALSMRSKSMTSELEDLDKVEEMTHGQKASPADAKVATIKPRPSSRCLVTAADMNALYHDRQGVAVAPPTVPGAFLGLPEKGTLKKQKSIGRTRVTLSVCI
uniref:SH3 and multiple ankyrin repeat domains 2 n=1 Tax=Gasterosteus aculeatus aculeatus TaxID=481459 RepID=A0AAQ4NWN3_GASAC